MPEFLIACCTCTVTLTSCVRRVVFTFNVWIGTGTRDRFAMVMTAALYSDAQDFCCRTVFAIPLIRSDPSVPEMARDKAPSIARPYAGRATARGNSHTPRATSLWRLARGQSCGAVCRSGIQPFCEPSLPHLAKKGQASSADRAVDPACS